MLTGLNLRLPISRTAVTISGAGSDALLNHPAHGVRHDDFLPELLLLEQLQRAQGRTGMAEVRVSSTVLRKRAGGQDDVREILCVLRLSKVLQITQVGDKVRAVQVFLRGQVVQVPRIGHALDELRQGGQKCDGRALGGGHL